MNEQNNYNVGRLSTGFIAVYGLYELCTNEQNQLFYAVLVILGALGFVSGLPSEKR
jgi:hypothetical protein